LGAVLLADACLLLDLRGHVLVGDEAVAAVVGVEHLGREGVATAVPDAQVGVDAHLHGVAGVNTSGRDSTARIPAEDFRRSPGLVSESEMRSWSCSSATRSSRRARCEPRQRCTPPPNAR